MIANVAGFLVGQAILSGKDLDVDHRRQQHQGHRPRGGRRQRVRGDRRRAGTIVKRASVANILMALVVIGGQLVGSAIPPRRSDSFRSTHCRQRCRSSAPTTCSSPVVALGFLGGYALVAVVVAPDAPQEGRMSTLACTPPSRQPDLMLAALDRLQGSGAEFGGFLANHGPMAADAMIRIGGGDLVDRWVD